MDKQKQIEELEQALMDSMDLHIDYQQKTYCLNYLNIAENLVNAGYGNLKEFVKGLKDELQSYSLLGIKQTCEIIDRRLKEYING